MQSRISYGLRTALISCAMGSQWGQFFVFAMGNDLGTSTDDGCHFYPGGVGGTVNGCHQNVFQRLPDSRYTQPPAAGIDWLGYLASAGMILGIAVIGYSMYRMPRRPPVIPLGNGSEESSDEEESDEVVYNDGQLEAVENSHEQRLREAGFAGEIPDHFIDPVSRSIMVEPVILITDNHTTSQSIEKDMALTLMRNSKPVCPLTRRPFNGYIMNRDLKNIIQTWVDKTVAECEKKNLNELPRDVSKQHLLVAQGMFAHRIAKSKSQPSQKRKRSKSTSNCSVGMR